MFNIDNNMINQLNAERQAAYPLREFTPIDYSQYLTPTTDVGLDSPEAVQARINQMELAAKNNNNPTPLTNDVITNANINKYSDYGINYDLNGDGVVGIWEGINPKMIWDNAVSGGKEALTGLVHLGTHPVETGKMLGGYLANVGYKSGGNPFKNIGYIATDMTDAILHPYALDSKTRNENLGNIIGSTLAGDYKGALGYTRDALAQTTHRFGEHPFDVALDFGIPVAGMAAKGITKAGKAATKAQSAIAHESAKIAQSTEKMREAGEAVVKNKYNVSPAELVRAAETGDWSTIPQGAKELTKRYSDVTNDTMKRYSPATWVEPEELSIVQKYARDNGITYQEAERIVKPVLDEANKVRQESGINVTRYTPNKGLADDVRKQVTVEEIPVETPKFNEILHHNTIMMEQSPEVLSGMRKILTPDEMYSLRGATGREAFDYIKETRKWTDRQLSDNLFDAGIKGIDGDVNRLFNAKKMGSYNPKADKITIDPKATDGDVLHEWSHKELKDTLKAAKAGDTVAIEELNELRKVLNLKENAKITNKMLENVADDVKTFINDGKLPDGALGEYIGKKYGIPEVVRKSGVDDVGIKFLDDLASQGDDIAAQVSNSAKLFKKGDIFPITHGLAEVSKDAPVDNIGRVLAGRFSKRAYGNATYEDIAKQIANPNDYINQLTKNYLDESVRNVLRNGYSGDINIRPANPKDAMYISRELLEGEGKSVKQALDSATTTPLKSDDIAIDKDYLKSFRDQYQLQQTNNPFGRTILGDAYNLRKSTALASGGYLVGNLQTGAANAIINSNVHLINDAINAMLTRGKLAKNLGVYRRASFKNTNVTPVGRKLQDINMRTGGALLAKSDEAIQNIFAEIAAHAQLRRQGVKPNQRLQAIKDMEASKLGDLINDVKLVSLINPTKSLAPSWMGGVGGVFNPFWRWVDTAAQSSLWMLNRHPVLANAVLFDIMSKVGYDKEMQNRLNIGVELDRPFVSYKVNPKTGEPREMSMEFLPQMNTLKFGSEVADALKGKGDLDSLINASIPIVGATLLAARGLNKYGKPMYRDHKSMYDSISVIDGKRYKLDPETGMPKPEGGHLDEIISALANETIGGISLFNRTLAPSAAWGISNLTGQDIDYYMPYGQALFGSFAKRGEAPQDRVPFLVAGDPTRPRGDQEISNMLRGIYETPYYPSPKIEQGIYNPSLLRGFYKGLNRRDMREQNILMNR